MFKRVLSLAMLLCVVACALPALSSPALAASADTYYLEVDIANQITTAYRTSDDAVVRQMLCSTGKGDSTPRGTFKLQQTRESTDRKEWYYISTYSCYVKYATRIKGPILFHSIPYTEADMDSIDQTALAELGQKASHGCVRLRWEDAKWIAENCPDGTTVKIFTGASQKTALRELLMMESFSTKSGMTYEQFTASTYKGDAQTLGRGDTGAQVDALQSRLIGLGFYSGAASGVYDNATIVGVMRFQAAADLAVTGVATQALLDRVQAEEALGADYSTLVPGCSGTLVRAFQQAMTDVGYYTGAVDGVYGEELVDAVKIFCDCNGLKSTKKVSPSMRKKLDKQLKKLNKRYGAGGFAIAIVDETSYTGTTKQKVVLRAQASASSKKLTTLVKGTSLDVLEKGSDWCKVEVDGKTGYLPTKELTIKKVTTAAAHWGVPAPAVCTVDMTADSVGEGVAALQSRLKELGFFTGATSPLYTDGTVEAVKAYQAAAGLEQTGSADVALQEVIFSRDDITGTRVTLKKGMSGPAVAAMQNTLRALQYFGGACDGRFGSDTAKAVKQFTRANGMAEASKASPKIQKAIFDQYFNCEATYGSGNYTLTIDKVKTKIATVKSATRLYKSKKTSSRTLAKLKKGDQAEVLKKGTTWTRLDFGGKKGYVKTKYLKIATRVDEIARFSAGETAEVAAMAFGEGEDLAIAAPEDGEPFAEVVNGLTVEAYEAVEDTSERFIQLDENGEPEVTGEAEIDVGQQD